MVRTLRFIRFLCWGGFLSICGSALIFTSVYLYLSPALPQAETLKEVRLQTPLRVYSSDQKLIAEFGEKRRSPLAFEQIPEQMIEAILSAEDNNFYRHNGVDIKGLLRAAVQLIQSGQIRSGGSTITMQVAKNFFLSHERVFSRKFNEILLALEIEQELTKHQILALYLNKIYLGNRAYGIEAAAQVYYGKSINELTLAQLTMIAGLPKAPSRYNPIINPNRAIIRRNWILGRMLALGHIDQSKHDEALSQPVTARYHGLQNEIDAPYFAEMVRADLLSRYGSEIYTDGFRVTTTIHSDLQNSANQAVHKGLMEYDRRHGYRGAESTIALTDEQGLENAIDSLKNTPDINQLLAAVVLSTEDQQAELLLRDSNDQILWNGMSWARRFVDINRLGKKPKQASDILKAGDLIRVIRQEDGTLMLAQIPEVQGALVSFQPDNGALLALVGGFNFQSSKFNRATQAARQTGSNFKPFIYSAALENGFTAASLINDAPVVFEADKNLEGAWRPQNDSGKFYGPTRLRTGLYKSRNMVSIRLLQAVGIRKVLSYVERFGFDPTTLPKDLSLALGSASMPPFDLASGYLALANGGYKVEPHYILTIQRLDEVLHETQTTQVCHDCPKDNLPDNATAVDTTEAIEKTTINEEEILLTEEQPELPQEELQPPPEPLEAPRIMDERVNYIMTSMLRDVIQSGTGRRAKALGRNDIGGKTGTTNEQKDAWFSGFNPDVHTTVWVGFDRPITLGRREYGGTAALPIWIDYMDHALSGVPEKRLRQPGDMITMRIDPATGKIARSGDPDAIFEVFRKEFAPANETSITPPPLELESEYQPPQELF